MMEDEPYMSIQEKQTQTDKQNTFSTTYVQTVRDPKEEPLGSATHGSACSKTRKVTNNSSDRSNPATKSKNKKIRYVGEILKNMDYT